MNVAKIALRWLYGEDVSATSVLHVRAADSRAPFDGDDLQALALAAFAWFTDEHSDGPHTWRPGSELVHSVIKLQEIEKARVLPTFEDFAPLATENWAGTADVALAETYPSIGFSTRVLPFPPQVCVLASLSTSEDSRQERGRVYWPATYVDIRQFPLPDPAPWSALDLAAGLTTPYLRLLYGAQQAHLHYMLRTALSFDGETQWCVFSRTSGRALSVNGFRIAMHLRTQRRRAVHPSPHERYDLGGDLQP